MSDKRPGEYVHIELRAAEIIIPSVDFGVERDPFPHVVSEATVEQLHAATVIRREALLNANGIRSEWPQSSIIVGMHARLGDPADRRLFNSLLVTTVTKEDLIDLVALMLDDQEHRPLRER